MPPARKFVRQIKVNLGHMDLAFLQFLTRSSESTMGDELRAAFHEYRRRHLRATGDAFDGYLRKEYLPSLADDTERSAAEADWDALGGVVREDSLASMFDTMPKLESRGTGLASSDAMFDEED